MQFFDIYCRLRPTKIGGMYERYFDCSVTWTCNKIDDIEPFTG